MRLSDARCSSEQLLALTGQSAREQLKEAVATIAGQSSRACWAVQGEVAHLLYEDGDHGLVPLTEFRKAG